MNGTGMSRSSQKRTRILDAAQKRFAHYGLAKVTVDDIAADLGISKAAVYYYFNTKEEVFREVISREGNSFITTARKIIDSELPSAEKLRHYSLKRLTLLNQYANLKLIGLQTWLEMKPLLSDVLKSFMQKEISLLREILQEGVENGQFVCDDVDSTALLIIHIYLGLSKQVFMSFSEFSNYEEHFKKLYAEVELFISLLINGLKIRK